MSRIEHWIGTLYRIKFAEEITYPEKIRLLEKDYDLDGLQTDIPISTNYDEDLVYYYGEFYAVDKGEADPNDDIIRAERDNQDVIQFELKFYNGGVGFSECLEEALESID
jgi:hypothetical protein